MEESQDLDILFTTDDWKPICFHMEPQGAQRQRVRTRDLYRYFLPEVGTQTKYVLSHELIYLIPSLI